MCVHFDFFLLNVCLVFIHFAFVPFAYLSTLLGRCAGSILYPLQYTCYLEKSCHQKGSIKPLWNKHLDNIKMYNIFNRNFMSATLEDKRHTLPKKTKFWLWKQELKTKNKKALSWTLATRTFIISPSTTLAPPTLAPPWNFKRANVRL